MKNIISYSLFGTAPQYWTSIPFNLIANDLIYNEFISRYYISEEATHNPLFKLFELVAQRSKKLEYEVIKDKYIGLEPTIWRMKPLWDRDVRFLFCRDLDAAPRSDERRATLYFQHSSFIIHGIRSYWTHTTKLMAGLCGFNVPKVQSAIPFYRTFDSYKRFGQKFLSQFCTQWQWGCDQHLLKRFFYTGRHYPLTRLTLDTQLNCATPLKGFNAPTVPKEKYDKVDLSHINPEILQICDAIVPQVGLPITVESTYLRQALKIPCELSKILNDVFTENKDLADHYNALIEHKAVN